MLQRVEFDVWISRVQSSRRYAVDVEADSGDDAAALGAVEAALVANSGSYKILAVYPVQPGEPFRDGVLPANEPVDASLESLTDADAIPEKAHPLRGEEDEQTFLRATLEGMGIKYDRRWGVARLKEALSEPHNAQETPNDVR